MSEAPTASVAQWTLSEELRIGSESAAEYALTDVSGIVVVRSRILPERI